MARSSSVRTQSDLDRVGRALGEYFDTDAVVVVGSQSVLVGWPDAPVLMRTSEEIDAYASNFKDWEAKPENAGFVASEDINALFGDGSQFHETHGFFIDGVDSSTALLPPSWQFRAVFREIESYRGKIVTIIAPSVEDMAVSKVLRYHEKDVAWLKAGHEKRPFNKASLSALVQSCVKAAEEKRQNAVNFIKSTLPDLQPFEAPLAASLPPFDPETHCAFLQGNDSSIFVRSWDDQKKLFHKVDNQLGPAVVTKAQQLYFIDGKRLSHQEWLNNPRVQEANAANIQKP